MRREEYKQRIVKYFKSNLKKGYTEESLKWALINQGYSRSVIESVLEQTHKELAKEAPILKERPIIRYEVLDGDDKPIVMNKPLWKRILGL